MYIVDSKIVTGNILGFVNPSVERKLFKKKNKVKLKLVFEALLVDTFYKREQSASPLPFTGAFILSRGPTPTSGITLMSD